METQAEALNLVPMMIPAADGSWLAVAGPDAPIRVGALEPTQQEARLRFAEAVQRSAVALERDHHAEET